MNSFYRVIRGIVAPFVRFLMPFKVEGIENIPETDGAVICCNHISMSDPFYLSVAVKKRQIHYMSKYELFKNPILRFVLVRLGAFAVKRGTGDTSAIDTAIEIVKNGSILGIFPEGTRYTDGLPPRKAKSGVAVIVAKTNAIVIPTAICRKGKFCFFRKTVVRFGKPIETSELNITDGNRNELRAVTSVLTEKITELWELGI